MKRTNILLCLIILTSCSKKVYNSSEGSFVDKKNKDVIVLTSYGFGNNMAHALKDAEKKAFELIMFKGLPNSELRNPLVYNEMESRRNNENFYFQFFENENYRNFITFSNQSSQLLKDEKNNLKKVQITIGINLQNLRNELKKSNIIKNFGY